MQKAEPDSAHKHSRYCHPAVTNVDNHSQVIHTENSLPKLAILRSPNEFRRVFQRAKAVSCPHAKLLFVSNSEDSARLGLAVSKKQIRHAVNRNRVKRVCREAFRHRKSQLSSLDIIAMVRGSAVELPPGEFRLHIDKLLDRIIAQHDLANIEQ